MLIYENIVLYDYRFSAIYTDGHGRQFNPFFWRCTMYAKPLKSAQIGDFRQVNFVLPADLYVRLKARCAADRTSLKSALTQAILNLLSEGE